jgi:hypothetical protein
MTHKIRAIIDPIRTLAFGAIGVNYAAVGAAVTDPIRILKFDNLTDVDLLVSIDGTTDHFVIPTTGFIVLDVCANKVRDDGFFIKDGTIFYVKRLGAAPSTGSLYITVIHA